MDEDSVEGGLLGVLAAGENHPGHPEEDDVVGGDEDVGGVEILVVLGVLIGPAQGGEGPEGGGEPSVQHVLLLVDMRAAAVIALSGIGLRDRHAPAIVAGPGGDAVAPPELAGDAPIMDVLHPVCVDLGEAVGDELDLPVVDHPERFLRQGLHLDEPLGGDERLHIGSAAVAGAHVVGMLGGFFQEAQGIQIGHDGLAGLIAVHALIFAAVLVDFAAVVQDADGFQVVAHSHLEVVGVVGGGHLHAAGAELHVHVIVGHDGDLLVHQGQYAGLAHQVPVAVVIGIHGHAGVAQHGLGPGGGHDDIAARLALDGVFEMPEVAGLLLILHLRVGEGGGAVGTPVNDAAALVDEALIVHLHKDVADRGGEALVHGEARPGPVAGGAQLLLLLHDSPAVLGLPVPDALQEFVPAQVVAGEALLGAQGLLHLNLGGDARVVGAGDPQRGVALHPLEADEDVLHGAVHGVAHVELAGDVGRRHHDGKGLLVRVPAALKAAVSLPHPVDAAFDLLGFVCFGKFSVHWYHSCFSILCRRLLSSL